ncbi:hypothetical protein NHX12_030064 [Muraenolepis orangiensis]|uniref:Uncharacterized protein n=1 Tax=Muraenolepis orangiensis TaxID=630683 RepID=A0A9Q0ILC5_9TELE|nr:hypothetical protein NHX12_030064 [Muraenolepis orangiensis]
MRLNVSSVFYVQRLTLQNLEEWFCEAENELKDPEQEGEVKILKFLLQGSTLCNGLFVPSRLCHYLVESDTEPPASFMDGVYRTASKVPPHSRTPWYTHSSINFTQ